MRQVMKSKITVLLLCMVSIFFTSCRSKYVYTTGDQSTPIPGKISTGFTPAWTGTDGGAPAGTGAEPGESIIDVTFEPVYFGYNSTDIGQIEEVKLEAIAAYLEKNATYNITINGHCDERGSDEYNRNLSEKRAMSVKDFLLGLNIAEARIFTVGYGEESPADLGKSEAAYAKNRRAEFVITTRN